MDFGWTPEQEEMHSAARSAGRGIARNREGGVEGELDHVGWTVAAELGLTGLCLPVEHGGLGLDLQTSARTIEGFGEGCRDMGLVFSACAHLFACCGPIAAAGCEELKRRALPRLASGEWIGANAITEAEAGSDALAIRATAKRDGDLYHLSGSKLYVTNGPVADLAVVYAVTNPGAGALSISAFAVELDSPGVAIGIAMKKTGLRGALIGGIHFEDCVVPVASRLGEEGQGALIFDASMQRERACLFAAYLGAMQRQLDEAVEFASTRRQFGRPIGKNQAVSHRIVDMKLRLETARLLVYRACWSLERGEDAAVAASLAKLGVSEAAVESGLDAIRVHGGAGVISEMGIDQALLDALPATVFSGTSEMQREIVARWLGL